MNTIAKTVENASFSHHGPLFDKVITHDGIFHADEKVARGFLIAKGIISWSTPFERRSLRDGVTREELDNPKICILDMGRELNPQKGNFDHHQDANIQATNMLVLEYFERDEAVKAIMKESMFDYLDRVDRGLVVEKPTTLTVPQIIRALNSLENGSKIADQVTHSLVFDCYFSAMAGKSCTPNQLINNLSDKFSPLRTKVAEALFLQQLALLESAERWESEVKKFGKYAVQDNDRQIVGWHELAEKDGVTALVTPSLRGGWNMISVSTDVFRIPSHETQTFLHASGFMAAYETKEAAINHAEEIFNN